MYVYTDIFMDTVRTASTQKRDRKECIQTLDEDGSPYITNISSNSCRTCIGLVQTNSKGDN